MDQKKPIRHEIVLSSTHVDSHGDVMAKSALEMGVTSINGDRKPRLGLEHDMTYPPLGRINDARLVEGKDGAFYLVAFQEYFDKRVQTILDDGTILIKEYFSSGGTPFSEVRGELTDEIEISVDKNNFESYSESKKFYEELEQEVDLSFKKMGLVRKANLSDPEIIIVLAQLYGLYFFGVKLFPKITDKLSDKVADDIAKLYDLIKVAVKKMVKYANPKNRPTSYIFEFPGDTHIELIIKTEKPDVVASAFQTDKIKNLREKAEKMKDLFEAEKIQFIYNDSNEWELNYLLTGNGETIGTPKSFSKRDEAFQELANKSIERNKGEST